MAILEGTNRKYALLLEKMLYEKHGVCAIEHQIIAGEWYDAIFASPSFVVAEIKPCSAHALLVRDCDAAEILQKISANAVITYGTEKSTLSISSVGEKCIVALQREIIDSGGRAFSIGEISVDAAIFEPEDACAMAGAMILGGLVQSNYIETFTPFTCKNRATL